VKTHTIAKALNELAIILRSGPNVEIKNLSLKREIEKEELSKEEIALNISTLLALSKIKKTTWVDFIEENRWPIKIQKRDSSRNLIGKILKYLEGNPDALKKLKNGVSSNRGQGFIELSNALSSLLEDRR